MDFDTFPIFNFLNVQVCMAKKWKLSIIRILHFIVCVLENKSLTEGFKMRNSKVIKKEV